jgi:hypothetical protein
MSLMWKREEKFSITKKHTILTHSNIPIIRLCPSLGTSELRKGKFSESLEHEQEYSLIATFLSYY